MTLSRQDIERIAALAALHVDATALPQLTQQIVSILEYVSQLDAAVDALGPSHPQDTWASAGPVLPPRADEVRPPDLTRDLKSFAVALRDGLFEVPKLPALGDD